MIKEKIFYVLILLLAASFHAYAEDKVFKIGMVVCLSSECAPDGKGALEGAQIAADEINGSGGVLGRQIKLIAQDTAEATSGAKAINAYRQLRLDNEIKFFIGPTWTPGGLTLAPVVVKEDVIMTSPSLGVSEFHKTGDNIFNSRGTDEITSQGIARLAIQKGWKRGAVFSSQQPWESLQGKIFTEEFERLGGKIVASVEPLPTTTALGSEALKIVSSRPDVIFFSNYVQQAISAKEVHKLGWTGNKLAAYVDETRRLEANSALDDTKFMTYQMPSEEFSRKYEERYQRKPEIPGGTGYDTVYIYAKAIEAAKTFDPKVVKKEILNVKFVGASGEVQFDKDGSVSKTPKLWKVTKTGMTMVEE